MDEKNIIDFERDLMIADWILSNDVDFIALVQEIGLEKTIKALQVIL